MSKPLTMTAEREAEDRKTLARTAGQFQNGAKSLSRLLIELDVERAAHQETQAKLAKIHICEICFNAAWEPTPAGERCSYCWLHDKLAETQAIARALLEALGKSHDFNITNCGTCALVAKAKGVLNV